MDESVHERSGTPHGEHLCGETAAIAKVRDGLLARVEGRAGGKAVIGDWFRSCEDFRSHSALGGSSPSEAQKCTTRNGSRMRRRFTTIDRGLTIGI